MLGHIKNHHKSTLLQSFSSRLKISQRLSRFFSFSSRSSSKHDLWVKWLHLIPPETFCANDGTEQVESYFFTLSNTSFSTFEKEYRMKWRRKLKLIYHKFYVSLKLNEREFIHEDSVHADASEWGGTLRYHNTST